MKRFALMFLYPSGFCSGNRVIAEHDCDTLENAIEFFKSVRPDLELNKYGYAKHGEHTYTIAQYL